MNPDQVLDRIIQANPKPAEGQVPGTVVTRSALLVELDRRSGDMQTQDKPAGQKTKPTSPPARPSRPRRLVPALGGAAAVMVALVIGVVLLSSDQDQATSGGVADVETAEQFLAALQSGDVAGYEALVDPDVVTPVGPFFGASSASWAYVSGFQAATHGTYTAECRETPTSPTIDVRCTIRDTNIFRETAGLDPESSGASFAIEDGTITLINLGSDLIFPALDQIAMYDGWLQVNYPEEYAGLMAALDEDVVIRTCTLDVSGNLLETCGASDGEIDPLLPMPVVDTAAQRARHSELTTEWTATLP